MSFTLQEFKIALHDLQEAAETVRRKSEDIRQDIAEINVALAAVEPGWTGPAGTSFAGIKKVYGDDMEVLTSLLEEMVRRMRHAYSTYHAMELANYRNVRS
ncbi:WXG100 family type VII secretion target [Streptomyces sp. H39-S7]|uniref:WXG100 family type VII secretion target n=1 Tax=Streptomyces sp. H39-S7 TaxID=3004357 RepID=UPI0022B06050|nr:WXG100 family type VII secretion target [Streptomyces sp. H39-S7]